MQDQREHRVRGDRRDPPRWGIATVVAASAIAAATVAGLWVLSGFCMTPPSSPLNLARWECGVWSRFLAVGILAAGVILIVATWRAMNRRSR